MPASKITLESTLKIAKKSAATDGNGDATVQIKVPGTAGDPNARLIYWGTGWFDNPAVGDCICKIEVVDVDNILGAGAGFVAGSYTETDDATLSGWFISNHEPVIKMESVGGEGHLMAGLYLEITVNAAASRSDTFRVNLSWGIPE